MASPVINSAGRRATRAMRRGSCRVADRRFQGEAATRLSDAAQGRPIIPSRLIHRTALGKGKQRGAVCRLEIGLTNVAERVADRALRARRSRNLIEESIRSK